MLAYPIKSFKTETWVQFVYLGNDSLIRQLNTELQRDDFALRGLTTQLMAQDITEIFNNEELRVPHHLMLRKKE